MTVNEVREIRERQSLETANMGIEELQEYLSNGANEVQQIIESMREHRIGVSASV